MHDIIVVKTLRTCTYRRIKCTAWTQPKLCITSKKVMYKNEKVDSVIIFQRWESFEPSSSTLGVDRHMHSWTFLYKINAKPLLLQTLFDVMRIFGSVEP